MQGTAIPCQQVENSFTYNIKCKASNNNLLCKEALPMLDYFIDFYGEFRAEKLIFIHGHETSWHYRTSVIDVINRMIKSEMFWKTDYGAIYKEICWHRNEIAENQDGWWTQQRNLYKIVYANTSIMKYISGYNLSNPCCATFYINSSLITNNPLSLYITVRDRLIKWTSDQLDQNKSPQICSYFMEFTWNMLLNRPYIDQNTTFA